MVALESSSLFEDTNAKQEIWELNRFLMKPVMKWVSHFNPIAFFAISEYRKRFADSLANAFVRS